MRTGSLSSGRRRYSLLDSTSPGFDKVLSWGILSEQHVIQTFRVGRPFDVDRGVRHLVGMTSPAIDGLEHENIAAAIRRAVTAAAAALEAAALCPRCGQPRRFQPGTGRCWAGATCTKCRRFAWLHSPVVAEGLAP